MVVVGAGSAGVSVANMLYNRFADEGRKLTDGDIALVDVRSPLLLSAHGNGAQVAGPTSCQRSSC